MAGGAARTALIVENRPGAASNIAAEAVVRAPADGHTLLWLTSTNAINASIYDKLSFNFIRDIAPVAHISGSPLVMEVNPSFPAKTVPEFIAHAKANPGRINMASAGTGTRQHVSGELFKMMAGVNLVTVPYRGDIPAITDLMGGQVQVYFSTLPSSIEYIRNGKLRALAVTTAARLPVVPEIPTIGEFIPGYEAIGWLGVGAPRSTPAEIVNVLNREINLWLAEPRIRTRLTDLGAVVSGGSPAQFEKFIAAETEKWGKVVKFAGIKPD